MALLLQRLYKMLTNTKAGVGLFVFSLSFSIAHSAQAIPLSQKPLFIGQSAKPTAMLAMSRDQELFYSAYPDYSNLSGGNLTMADTTYRNDFDYYGYFDANWCYKYDANSTTVASSRFIPDTKADSHKCNQGTSSGQWSGNFLNWSSMTRMDVLRRVLFGGKRSVDTAVSGGTPAETVLERTFLPKESHAFSKPYNGSAGPVRDYTPYTSTSITLCNVSTDSNTTGYPVIRVAAGIWTEWSHTEVQQCQWSGAGGNVTWSTSPQKTANAPTSAVTVSNELVAKVKVCVPGKDADGNIYNADSNAAGRCSSYESGSYKPIGLLQKTYTNINFGLVTGTWGKNQAGGVLRKKAARLAGNVVSGTDTVNEFFETTGQFNANASGIISNLNLFKIADFTFSATDKDKSYNGTSDWWNPIGEIYAEALRYVVGKGTGTGAYDSDDSGKIAGLTRILSNAWGDPVPASNWCSKCSIVLISSGPNSYDGNDLTDSYLKTINSSFSLTDLNNKTDSIGTNEFGSVSNNVFFGGTVANQCSAALKKFSQLLGICPEAPITQGSYAVSGLAYLARTTDMRPAPASGVDSYPGLQSISTYAVELSEGLPNFNIPVGSGTVSFVPVCTNNDTTQCSLVGVRVENIELDSSQKPVKGKYLFYWEDQTAGSDYDLDAVQRIEFCVGAACGTGVNADQIKITNTLPYWATGTGRLYITYNIAGTGTTATPTDGLQKTQQVTRGGYDPHNLRNAANQLINSTLGNTYWYNAILPPPAGDALPASSGLNVYSSSKTFTAGTTTAVKTVKSPLFYAAKYGNFVDSNNNGKPDLASEWDLTDVSGNVGADGIPDNYFAMKNPAKLETSLANVFDSVIRQVASGSGVATNSARLDTGTLVYQARFYADGWSGELRALRPPTTITGKYVDVWSSVNTLTSATGRQLFSISNGAGIDFNANNWSTKFTNAQRLALGGDTAGPNIVNWVLGTDVSGYRNRGTVGSKKILGDIINSTPTYSGAEDLGFKKLDTAYGSASYDAFVTAKKSRKDVVYVGANDGQLHAIDAKTGAELFAYVPSMIFDKLPIMASVNYGQSIDHVYSVDGPVTVSDAYINGAWKTILVGTLGAGGRGLYVLDVTNPASFNSSNVLFELTETDYPELGNILGKPVIAPVGGRWKIVFGNGYNSTSGRSHLMVIDIAQPKNTSYSKAVPTNTDINNGLSALVVLQDSTSGAAKYAYGGDLQGNLWKFDISSNSPASWGAAFGSTPLFKAKDSSGNAQPIVASPTLGINMQVSTDAIMVYFGTGKYLETDDVGSTQMDRVQSFYSIVDKGASVTGRSQLHQKLIKTQTALTRDIDDSGASAVKVNWTTEKGWFLDFPKGERITNKALLLYDRLLFSTMLPNMDSCSFGGSGWIMELVGVGDIYGTDVQLLPDNGQYLEFFLPGPLVRSVPAQPDTKTPTDPPLDPLNPPPPKEENPYADLGEIVNESNIAGEISARKINAPSAAGDVLGRMSWRQLK